MSDSIEITETDGQLVCPCGFVTDGDLADAGASMRHHVVHDHPETAIVEGEEGHVDVVWPD